MSVINQKKNINFKTIGVLVLVDNRNNTQLTKNTNPHDFRGSAFKQTQIDPLQPRNDMIMQDDAIIYFNLIKRVEDLQSRVSTLQEIQAKDQTQKNQVDQKNKKKRRKFTQLKRNHKCHYEKCQKIYGSETSLKYHLKSKHQKLHKKY